MKDLSKKAMLANLNIRQWSAHKYDKKVSAEIEEQHHTKDVGRFNKKLIAEKELKEIQKAGNAARTFFYEHTLPWGDNGDRLLPATNYLDFVTEFKVHQQAFEKSVKDFLHAYPTLKNEAKTRLNGMFREADYPCTSMMPIKFGIKIDFTPISNLDDFRLEVDQDEIEQLKKEISSEIQERITQTTTDIWTRIKDAVGHMIERLSQDDAAFKNSLVNNIADLIDVLPKLNFTNNPDVAATIQSMKALIIDPDVLRTNKSVRSQKAAEAQRIFNTVSAFLD